MSDFKFNIKLTPITKTKDWEYTRIQAGRIKKTCDTCGNGIAIGQSSMTFNKIISIGAKKRFETLHAHLGVCSGTVARKLKFPLSEIADIIDIK